MTRPSGSDHAEAKNEIWRVSQCVGMLALAFLMIAPGTIKFANATIVNPFTGIARVQDGDDLFINGTDFRLFGLQLAGL